MMYHIDVIACELLSKCIEFYKEKIVLIKRDPDIHLLLSGTLIDFKGQITKIKTPSCQLFGNYLVNTVF